MSEILKALDREQDCDIDKEEFEIAREKSASDIFIYSGWLFIHSVKTFDYLKWMAVPRGKAGCTQPSPALIYGFFSV